MKQMGPILFTKEGLDKLISEKEQLQKERPAAVEDLAKARAMGDLSENGYYKSARAKLSSVDSRIRHLTFLIQHANIKGPTASGIADIGMKVTLQQGDEEKTYALVGGYESNPSEGKLSIHSPIGKALVGKKVGETVTWRTPNGEFQSKLLKII